MRHFYLCAQCVRMCRVEAEDVNLPSYCPYSTAIVCWRELE